MIDMHCHILYGIDDGCKTIEESIETIRNMKSVGFNTIVLTPHYIEDSLFKANNNLHDYHLINIERDKKGIFKYKNYKISTSKENEYVIAFVIGEIKNDD